MADWRCCRRENCFQVQVRPWIDEIDVMGPGRSLSTAGYPSIASSFEYNKIYSRWMEALGMITLLSSNCLWHFYIPCSPRPLELTFLSYGRFHEGANSWGVVSSGLVSLRYNNPWLSLSIFMLSSCLNIYIYTPSRVDDNILDLH